MEGRLGVTPTLTRYPLCKVKSLYHFIILVETGNQQIKCITICVKRENYQRVQHKFCFTFSFQFFLLMLCISLVLPISRYSAHEFCLILPAECSLQNSLILVEILPAEFIQAYSNVSSRLWGGALRDETKNGCEGSDRLIKNKS